MTAARTLREIRRQGLIYAGLAPFVVIALFPICWMVITAFKQDADLYRMDGNPFWFHLPPTSSTSRASSGGRTSPRSSSTPCSWRSTWSRSPC